MKFEFNSLQELKAFIEFVNGDKDSFIEQEAKTLNKTAAELRESIEPKKEKGEK